VPRLTGCAHAAGQSSANDFEVGVTPTWADADHDAAGRWRVGPDGWDAADRRGALDERVAQRRVQVDAGQGEHGPALPVTTVSVAACPSPRETRSTSSQVAACHAGDGAALASRTTVTEGLLPGGSRAPFSVDRDHLLSLPTDATGLGLPAGAGNLGVGPADVDDGRDDPHEKLRLSLTELTPALAVVKVYRTSVRSSRPARLSPLPTSGTPAIRSPRPPSRPP